MRGTKAAREGCQDQEAARELMLVEVFKLNVKKVEIVIMKYMRRAKMVREGLY